MVSGLSIYIKAKNYFNLNIKLTFKCLMKFSIKTNGILYIHLHLHLHVLVLVLSTLYFVSLFFVTLDSHFHLNELHSF